MFIMNALEERVYIAQGVDYLPSGHQFRLFKPEDVEYEPFCDDFGPMNMSSVVHFIEQLQAEMEAHPDAKIIYSIPDDARSLSNAVFLLGAYMIIALNKRAAEVHILSCRKG